jgi:CheY-like chemotaxis protein
MLDDLLNGVSLGRGSVTLTDQSLDVAALVNDVVSHVAPQIEARRQSLHVSLPPSPVPLHCDPMRLMQILGNLLTNASIHTPDGGSISVLAETMENELVIDVIDDGAGIDPTVLPHVFNMFAQGSRIPGRSREGSGADLVISRQLAEIHGGTLIAASPGVGQGSSFTLRLPLAATAIENTPSEQPSGPAAPSSDIRVLIIEDNEDISMSFSLVLSQAGFVTKTAHSGEDGLSVVEEFMPDAVLLDIGLPGIDGFEVARRLQRMPLASRMLVIALSGFTRGIFREGAGAHFDHYLTKPVDPVEVAALIKLSLESIQRAPAK